MKNILKVFFTLTILFITTPVHAAQSVKVSALTEFNSLRPAKTMKVITLQKAEFNNGLIFEDGTVINGEIIDVKQPKRGKLNASFKFKPTSYTYNGKTIKIEDEEFIAKYSEYKELDKAGLATSAATTAGSMIFHIPLLSEGVSFVKGFWKNPENNRLKSAGIQVYKDSPLSYIEEGKDIEIKENTMFILKFKSSKHEDLDEPAPNNVTPVNEQTSPSQLQTNQQDAATDKPVTEIQTKPADIQIVNPEEVLKEVESSTAKQQF